MEIIRIKMGATQLSSIPVEYSGKLRRRLSYNTDIPSSMRRTKNGPKDFGTACSIIIIPQSTMLVPRYLPRRSRCEMYMVGKTQMRNPRPRGSVEWTTIMVSSMHTEVEGQSDKVVMLTGDRQTHDTRQQVRGEIERRNTVWADLA